jgi:hypothetical protein
MEIGKIYNSWLTQALLITAVAVALGFIIAETDIAGAGGLLALPFVVLYLVLLFKNPRLGLYTTLNLGFFVNGLIRYSTAPFGLSIDIFLLLTLIAALCKVKRNRFNYLKNPFVYGIAIWTAYTLFEVVNPESRSFLAWFYAVRGTSLYMVQLIIVTILVFTEPKEVNKFIRIWIIWSVIACFWGLKQLYFGVNHAEQLWLDAGAYKTHILFGRLRVFSFYSDAGQFGAAMGHIALVCTILAFGPVGSRKKLVYFGLAVLFFWGMAISGTRGANFVPLSGILMYLFLTKNFKILSVGALIVGLLFCGLKFTKIGAGNYQIQRMRSSMDPNDPSLQVRLNNQKKLSAYLASRPIGGGIGSAGSWGQRFSPGTLLADTPTDSWYVRIWAENGIIGLWLHIGVIVSFILTGVVLIFRIKNDMMLRQIAMALFSGFVGIAVASYGNQVLGQAPTGIVSFMSLAFVWLIYRWDKTAKKKILIKNEEE